MISGRSYAMSQVRTYLCEICGIRKRPDSKGWFLVLENQWRDNLEILAWDPVLAAQPSMMHLCSSEHVQELVCEWMRPTPEQASSESRLPDFVAGDIDAFRRAALQLGQLSVDRALLGEDHEHLMAVLDALEMALQAQASSLKEEDDPENTRMLVYDA